MKKLGWLVFIILFSVIIKFGLERLDKINNGEITIISEEYMN